MKKAIGIMGTPQINHIIPLLEQEFNVVELQSLWDSEQSNIKKVFVFCNKLRRVDVLYNVFTSPYFYKKLFFAKLMKKKVVTHWIGTDARCAAEGFTNLSKLKLVDKHVSCFEPLSQQLQEIGVSTSIVPIVPFNLNFDINKMPDTHSVLIYMPKGVECDYGYDDISRVFVQFPNLIFNIVANDDVEKFKDYSNVRVLGRLSLEEMEKLYDEISIVVRIHINDGLSMSVLEALAKGKKVIWNYSFPCCLPGRNEKEICDSLNLLLKEKPHPDMTAHNYIKDNYSKEQVLSIYKEIFNEL